MCTFYASNKTVRNTADRLLKDKITLSLHPLEKHMIPEYLCAKNQIKDKSPEKILEIIECYVDNFIGICQATSQDNLQHIT